MADPKQKSLEAPYLWRIPTIWRMPQWQQAAQWRFFVYNQPIAMLCRAKLINYLLGLPWEVSARDPDEKDALEPDINYYSNWVFRNFDEVFDMQWQDALDLPIGGTSEILRFRPDDKPVIQEGDEEYRVTRTHPRGHVFKLVNIDGATLFPTYEPDIPLAQKIPDLERVAYFTENEIGRIGIQPRTEMRLKGYFKPPPEQIYLAMQMVGDADHFYHDLLKEVPPIGILDLMDMAQKDAADWVGSVRSLFEGNDPFKIPVLYQHEKPASFIPFGKSPQELLFDTASLRYARIVAASYGLTLGNLGLEPKGETLAGSIRDDMQASQGYGFVIEKTKGLIDGQILPPYLEWNVKVQDFEKLTGKGRAFLVVAQALKAAKEIGAIKPSEVQSQLVRDGFITVEVEAPDDEELAQQAQAKQLPFGQKPGANGNQAANQLADKVPPAEGGLGDTKKEKADYKYASTQFDMPDNIIRLVQGLQTLIDSDDLTEEDGLENNPHVTIKYGLVNDDPEGVKYVARQYQPFYISLGNVSLFERDEFDVVKIEIEGDTLRQLNAAISGLGAVDTYSGYNPHLTLAYVKPGMGKKYLGLSVPHQSVMVSTISFSSSDGYITKIPLGNFQQLKAFILNPGEQKTRLIETVKEIIAPIVLRGETVKDWQDRLDEVVSFVEDEEEKYQLKVALVDSAERDLLAEREEVEDVPPPAP